METNQVRCATGLLQFVHGNNTYIAGRHADEGYVQGELRLFQKHDGVAKMADGALLPFLIDP